MISTELDPTTIGRRVPDLRRAIGWTQAELARRADSSQATISAIECGHTSGLSCRMAARLLKAMGARASIIIDVPYLADRERQTDATHARCVAYVATRLERAGWLVAVEVEIGGDRARGWIDVLAWHPGTHVVLIVEVKTELRDMGAVERQLSRYERAAWRAARSLGWPPRAVVGALLVLATTAVDERARENRRPLDRSFPARAVSLQRIVATGRLDDPPRRHVAMIDPMSRRADWLRRLRIDGRRSAAKYADYASFMRARTERSRAHRRSVRSPAD